MTTKTNIEAVALSDEQIHEIASSYMEVTDDVYVSFLPSNLDKFARALLASKPAMPKGWRLVPVEPTKKMIDAAQRYTWVAEEDATESGIWRHMLAASPAPASPSGEYAAEQADEAVLTEEMIDAARPLFLAMECGAKSIESIREYFVHSGSAVVDSLPEWFRTGTGHLTKAGKAIVAWHAMEAARAKDSK